MSDVALQKAEALRAEFWQAVIATPQYQAFKGIDAAVVALGGHSAAHGESASPAQTATRAKPTTPPRRLSQGDAAEAVLQDAGAPMGIRSLLDTVMAQGVQIRGDPIANFRSTLSRDNRFHSIMHNGGYYWWLTGVDVPEGWKEATDPSLPGFSVASDSNGQEGGDDHAATIATY